MKTTKITKLLGTTTAAIMLLLTGCGGGGGAGPQPSPVVGTPSLTIALTDLASGVTSNSISLDKPIKATATVLDANKSPVANAIVSFTVNPTTLVAVNPSSASVLTNASGVALVQLAAASVSSAGAGTLSASTTVNSSSVSGSVNFNVGAAGIGLSALTTGTTSLAAYGTTSVKVNVTGVSTSYPVTVQFTSTCTASGKATLTSSVQSVGGVATANYTDNKCASTDTITASVAGTSVSISTSLAVQTPSGSSIQFVSATPENIVLKGTGSAGFQESSLVKFKVVDNNNQGIANASVKLYLSTNTGGIQVDSSSTAISSATAITKTTDANGEVQVSVQSGTVPTPVWINAETGALKTQSSKLTISTGRPTQDRFSLSVGTPNIEGFSYDGVTTSVTARASDRLGNPVPDGTIVNFIAGGGQIGPSCQTASGSCSVTFTSGNPRHTGNVGIVAYALGEESFFDSNGNNNYDTGERFTDLGNVFLNIDGRLSFDALSDQQIIYNNAANGVCAAPMGESPLAPAVPNTCDLVWGQAHVRQESIVIMSGSTARAVNPSTTESSDQCVTSTTFTLRDENNNPMPAGTSIAISTTSLGVPAVLPALVLASSSEGGTSHTATLTRSPVAPATTCPSILGSTLPLVITTPKGIITLQSLTI